MAGKGLCTKEAFKLNLERRRARNLLRNVIQMNLFSDSQT